MEHDRSRFSAPFLVMILVSALVASVPVHADGPTDVQFVGATSLTYSGADANGVLTANSTVRQGDFLNLEIPVENVGMDTQVASVVLNVSQIGWNETVYFESISLDSMTAQVLNYLSSNQVSEGLLEVELSINNTSATLTDSILIGPPPLPDVNLEIILATESFVSGDLIEFNITSDNLNGERTFEGNVVCSFLDDEVYNESLLLDVGNEISNIFSLYARPGLLQCGLEGDRNQSSETLVEYSLQDLSSAVFAEAGSSGFTFLGGPFHVGDDLEASLIVRNQGDGDGNVRLQVDYDGVEFLSDSLSLSEGAAGELRVEIQDLREGTHEITWNILSLDGIVAPGLQGTSNLTVLPSQSMQADLNANLGTEGVVLDWNVSITNGVDRDVKLRFGYRVSGTDVFVNEQTVTLGSGTLTGQTTLGAVQSNTVLLRMEPVGWTSSSNSFIATATYEQIEAEYSVQIDPIALPREPVEGEDATVTVTFQNSGSVEGPAGVLYLMDSSGLLLAQATTNPLQASSSRNLDFTFTVPDGNEMILTAELRYDSKIVEDEQSFLVSPQILEDESMDIPFVAIGGGIATASCVILVLHLRRGGASEESPTKKTNKEKKSKPSEKKKAEPVEKSCPACERKLRIPGDYSGTVRCPDCSEKFMVEAEESFDLDEELDSIEESEPEPVVEKKIEIACPECSSKLRVPSSYKGSVRCPSCSNVFSAA
jgi:ribosomal protein S27E